MSDQILLSVREALVELQEESAVPKNIRQKIDMVQDELSSDIELYMKVNRALCKLDEISDSINLPSYVRTQIWNISSVLEKIEP